MKKAIAIIILVLLLSGCDIFKDPVELCMDRVIAVEGKGSTASAAKLCTVNK